MNKRGIYTSQVFFTQAQCTTRVYGQGRYVVNRGGQARYTHKRGIWITTVFGQARFYKRSAEAQCTSAVGQPQWTSAVYAQPQDFVKRSN